MYINPIAGTVDKDILITGISILHAYIIMSLACARNKSAREVGGCEYEDETSRAYLRDFAKDIFLTETFNNPKIVFRNTNPRYDRSIVIRQANKANMAWFLIMLLIADRVQRVSEGYLD